jgi:TolB-like protein/Tfp pilus assembly protein PilF
VQYLVEAARSKSLDRIAIAYTVGAWAAVQAASIGAPTFSWPQWVLQAVVTAALIGLPVVLIGAWGLGVRKQGGRFLQPSRADLHVLIVLILFLLLVGTVFLWAFWPRSTAMDNSESASAIAPANSLAVLPFVNLSGDSKKEYFSDGISEELLSHLANTPQLRVAARTSSFAFKGRRTDIQTIARALHVHAILEGSVREAGNRVRIRAELVNGNDGFQIWSQSYDRELTNVLTLQDEIARSVASSLATRLAGKMAVTAHTIDPEAYRLYLLGKFYVTRGNKEDLLTAISLLKKTAALAPEFADGLALMGDAEVLLAYNYSDPSSLATGEQALQRALAIDPKNVPALKALTDLSIVTWRWSDVLKYFRVVLSVNPNSYDALLTRSGVADIFGFAEESSRADEATSRLDPLSLVSKFNLATGYQWQHKNEQAARAIHEALVINPTDPDARNLECIIEVSRKNLARAKQLSALLPKEGGDQNRLGCAFDLAVASGDIAQARASVNAAATDAMKNGGSNTDIGDSYLKIGDFKNAMAWYERAYTARERALLGVPRLAPPAQRAFFQTPQWKALWARPPIREWSAARIEAGRIFSALH